MAIRFEPSGEYLEVTTNLPSVDTFSISFWFKLSVDINTFATPWSLCESSANRYVIIQTASNGTSLGLYVSTTFGPFSVTIASCTIGTWYYLAMTASSYTFNNYFAAADVATLANTTAGPNGGTIAPGNMRIGNNSRFNETMNGCVAAFKCWSGAVLTADEIANERWTYMPQRTANLHMWTPLLSHADLADYGGGGRNWTSAGTLATEDGPPIILGTKRRKTFTAPTILSSNHEVAGNINARLSSSFTPSRSSTTNLYFNTNLNIIPNVNSTRPINSYFNANLNCIPNINSTRSINSYANTRLSVNSNIGRTGSIQVELPTELANTYNLIRTSSVSINLPQDLVFIPLVSKSSSLSSNIATRIALIPSLENSRAIIINVPGRGYLFGDISQENGIVNIDGLLLGSLSLEANLSRTSSLNQGFNTRLYILPTLSKTSLPNISLYGASAYESNLSNSSSTNLELHSRGAIGSNLTRDIGAYSFSNLDLGASTTISRSSNLPLILTGDLSTSNVITNTSRLYLDLGGNLYLLGILTSDALLPSLVSHYEYSLLVSRNREYSLYR